MQKITLENVEEDKLDENMNEDSKNKKKKK